MKTLPALALFLAVALAARAGVRLEWDAAPDPDLYFRVEANGGTYLAAGPALTLSLPPGLCTFRVFAVNALTGAESLPLVSGLLALLEIEESADLLVWRTVREIIEPVADDRHFWRTRLNP